MNNVTLINKLTRIFLECLQKYVIKIVGMLVHILRQPRAQFIISRKNLT